jgi:hypothetical protein
MQQRLPQNAVANVGLRTDAENLRRVAELDPDVVQHGRLDEEVHVDLCVRVAIQIVERDFARLLGDEHGVDRQDPAKLAPRGVMAMDQLEGVHTGAKV